MSRFLYTLTIWLLLPWALLHLLWRARRQPEYLRHWGERFGSFRGRAVSPQPTIWLHAVSVGETRAAQPLVALLRSRWPQHRILFTHMTPTGRQTSEEIFGHDANVDRVYLPYDCPWSMRSFLRHFRPVIGIVMETELWPNLIAACHDEDIPLLLVNARLSEKSARRYAHFPNLTRQALRGLVAIAAQGAEDAARLEKLGACEVRIGGNMKFDIEPPPQQLQLGAALCEEWGGDKRAVLLAASTRDGEEALLLDALLRRPIRDLLLVIVPRHPQRFAEVARLVEARELRMQRRSESIPLHPETQVLLGDSMGEMFAYYAASDIAFIGGSLLDYGSQNLIEACAVGVPLLLGPSTYNFADAAAAALACGAARHIDDAEGIVAAAAELLGNPSARKRMRDAGLAFAGQHRGASQKMLALVEQFMVRRV
jgi:3-deoxy-D-manno-octulosonic-acid transferase